MRSASGRAASARRPCGSRASHSATISIRYSPGYEFSGSSAASPSACRSRTSTDRASAMNWLPASLT